MLFLPVFQFEFAKICNEIFHLTKFKIYGKNNQRIFLPVFQYEFATIAMKYSITLNSKYDAFPFECIIIKHCTHVKMNIHASRNKS